MQRHVALPEDIANEAGEGLLVGAAPFSPMLSLLSQHHGVGTMLFFLKAGAASFVADCEFVCQPELYVHTQVQKQDLNNASLLGQIQPASNHYM